MRNRSKVFREVIDKYQKIPRTWDGLLGDGLGKVDVPGRKNYVWVRIEDQAPAQVFNKRVTSVYNQPVIVGYDPIEPKLFQVLSVKSVASARGVGGTQDQNSIATHHRTHEWMSDNGGGDVVFSQLRQIMPMRPAAVGGMNVDIYRSAPVWFGDKWERVSGQTLNLTAYVPITGARYNLLYVDSTGIVKVSTGTVKSLQTLYPSDIPSPFPGTIPIAAVRTYSGQTGILETRSWTDLADLRWMTFVPPTGTSGGGGTVPSGTFVSITGSVMTGRLSLPSLTFQPSYISTGTEPTGTTYYDTDAHTISTVLENGVILQHGQEVHIYGKNVYGSQISNGQAVSITANNGSFVAFTKTNISTVTGAYAFAGLATQDISNNGFGYVTSEGIVHELDTSSWNEGDTLYVSSTPGVLTNVYPTAPTPIVEVGVVVYKHAIHGQILVHGSTTHRLQDLSDVDGTPLTTTGQFYVWNNLTQVFDANFNINDYQLVADAVSLTQLHEHVYNEDHTAECNGIKTNFITAQQFGPETTQVYINGLLQRLNVHYTEDALYNSLTIITPPVAGDELIFSYLAA